MYFLSANYLHTSWRRRTMEKILFLCSKINFNINKKLQGKLEFTANTYNIWKIFVKYIASFIWGKKDFTAEFPKTEKKLQANKICSYLFSSAVQQMGTHYGSKAWDIVWNLWRWICGSFFLSLSFSCSQVVIKKSSNDNFFGSKKGFEWKRHHLSENFIILKTKLSFLMTF